MSIETPKFESSGNEDHRIVEMNLEKLTSDFSKVLSNESMGGNAGEYLFEGVSYPCSTVNMLISPESGEILFIGNKQDGPEFIRNVGIKAGVIVAYLFDKKTEGMVFPRSFFAPHVSDRARKNFEDSLGQFGDLRIRSTK